MKRVLLFLSLVAAISGPFLRASEGASDLGRSLDELSGRNLVEEVDGGVGDDEGAAIVDNESLLGMFSLACLDWQIQRVECKPLPNCDNSSSLIRCASNPFDFWPDPGRGTISRLAHLRRFLI